jgi:hypothetical protein
VEARLAQAEAEPRTVVEDLPGGRCGGERFSVGAEADQRLEQRTDDEFALRIRDEARVDTQRVGGQADPQRAATFPAGFLPGRATVG